MKSALLRLREARDSLSATERSIADYLLAHPEEAMELTVEKTVELIAGGLNDTLPAHAIRECAARIRQHTRA